MGISDIIAISGIIVGVIGIAIGIVYAKRSGKPAFKQTGNEVITAVPKRNITVQYSGKDVSRVTRTKIAFWNAGRTTLEGASVVASHPIKFRFQGEGTEILSAVILATSDNANDFTILITDNNSTMQINFDYLEYRQGALIEILHTSNKWGATITGKIKGLPHGIRETKSSFDWVSGALFFVTVQVLIIASTTSGPWRLTSGIIFGISLISAISFVINTWIHREPKTLSLSEK